MSENSRFHSALASHIEHFLVHHRALGKRFNNEENALRLLDNYVMEQNVTTLKQITPSLLEDFLQSRPRTTARSYNHLLNVIERLFHWLVAQRILADSPLHASNRRSSQQRLPFLFDRSQVEQLLEAASQLTDAPHAYQRGNTYKMIFALMYGLGLRVSEVASLCYQDLDLERECLRIRHTKFSKCRLVPFGPHMSKALRRHWEHSASVDAVPQDPLFSLSRDRRQPIGSKSISRTFRRLTNQLELPIPSGVCPPRLHCLRHSFAVATLIRWYRSGVDPAGHLLYLSVFMGHVNPASTAVYLTITAELLQLANGRFSQFAEPVWQEATP